MGDTSALTLTGLWKSWLRPKHSIRLPSSPTQTADSESYIFSHDLHSRGGGHCGTSTAATSALLSLPFVIRVSGSHVEQEQALNISSISHVVCFGKSQMHSELVIKLRLQTGDCDLCSNARKCDRPRVTAVTINLSPWMHTFQLFSSLTTHHFKHYPLFIEH